MQANSQEDVTTLLVRASKGDSRATDELFPLVYTQLHDLATDLMLNERVDHTLQPTALVHEAYLRMIDQTRAKWENRTHFYFVAAQVLRRILVDHARGHARAKRGGSRPKLQLDDGLVAAYEQDVDLLSLDDALCRLADLDPQRARVVELRFFGGLTIEEAAGALEVSTRTVERQWRFARAWLYRDLSDGRE